MSRYARKPEWWEPVLTDADYVSTIAIETMMGGKGSAEYAARMAAHKKLMDALTPPVKSVAKARAAR